MNLVITCDDCGLSEGINHATLELHQAGMATAASVITNFPATAHAFELFAPHKTLEIGAHLNLSEGLALTGKSPLTDDNGRFLPISTAYKLMLHAHADYLEAVEREFDAQMEVFTRAGVRPAHVTTHMHFHTVPALRDVVFLIARRYQVNWVRAYRTRDTLIPNNPLLFLPRPRQHENTLDYLAPVMYWLEQNPSRMADEMRRLKGTVELVVHPDSPDDPTFPPNIAYSPKARDFEIQYLRRVLQGM